MYSITSFRCEDEVNWKTGGEGTTGLLLAGMTCAEMTDNINFCTLFMSDDRYSYQGKDVSEACCLCGGSDFRIVAPSEIPSLLPSVEPSQSQSPTFNGPSDVPSISLHPSESPSSAPSACEDEPGWKIMTKNGSVFNIGCAAMVKPDGSLRCDESLIDTLPYYGKVAWEACCVCGGGDHIIVAPSQVPTDEVRCMQTTKKQLSFFDETNASLHYFHSRVSCLRTSRVSYPVMSHLCFRLTR